MSKAALKETVQETEIPKGYVLNAQGHLVHKSALSDRDKECDKVVKLMIKKAKNVREELADFKMEAMLAMQNFIDFSAAEYDKPMGGKKGNVTIFSFDGRYKIQRSMQDSIVFDERLQIAKELIDDCLHRWAKGSRNEIKTIIGHAFQTDKEGNVSPARILGLKSHNFDDDTWKKAMQAITDSTQFIGSKPYIRFYERDDNGKYQPISLDIAAA